MIKSEPKYKFNEKIHAHTLDDKPLIGTSTIVGVVAKPLTWWSSGMAVAKLGWTNPKTTDAETVKSALQMGYDLVKGLSLEEYGKLLGEAYKAHSVKLKDTAEAGTDMHSLLENYVKECIKTSSLAYGEIISKSKSSQIGRK